MKNKKRLLVAFACFLFLLGGSMEALAMQAPYTPPTVTVDYGGTKYTISSQNVSYTSNTSLMTSQPWWGNAVMANALAGLTKMGAGGYLRNSSAAGAFFGYGLSNFGSTISLAYWDNALSQTINCQGCYFTNAQYYFATLISMTPDITLASLVPSLTSTATGLDSTMTSTDMLINGAHSRPLSRRVAVGENTAWIAGDWGRDDHGNHDGSLGVAEIGIGRNFGPAQVNISAGKNWAQQSLAFGGNIDADGQYLMVEGIIPVSEAHGLFATVGTYRQWGSVDVRRGYLNSSGTADASSASPDTRTWGVRARLDWENAFAVKSMEFNPYVDVSYNHSHMDGYTETGGGLPAQFDGRDEHSSELHTGLNGAIPLASTNLKFVANLEAAHQFNDTGAATSGQVIGLFTFSLPGQSYQSTWLKGGAGVEGMLGKGKTSLMLNGTSRSGMPNAWLAASYQLAF